MDDSPVLFEVDDHVGLIRLNQPTLRNSMRPELLEAFTRVLAEASACAELRCLVITGSGSCFSAGADLESALAVEADGLLPHERSYAMYAPFLRVLDVELPVLAAMNGHAVGGGFGLALLCDIRVANRGAKYGANFARLGLHPGLGISYLLPRLVGASRAAEMLFTGQLIRGDEAERIGLVSRAVDADEVLPVTLELAHRIAAAAPLAVRSMKRSLYRGLEWDVRRAAALEAGPQAETLATADAKEGVAALLEKREPEFHGR
ncbi:MAG: enoyl-CoA hydratase/isomerase family protein [Deltaproteobacteria bacterium]|nr:enoyl-CoA hydratase/isomerase family protein [Deltaproteobacteria bacterium]